VAANEFSQAVRCAIRLRRNGAIVEIPRDILGERIDRRVSVVGTSL
jgi:hypothetical protein